MKKSKLLMPIIGITTLSTIAMPLASCSCKQEDTSTRDVSVDITLSDKVTVKTEKSSSGDYSVVLSCKDTTTYIPKIRAIIIGEYVLNSNEYTYDLKSQTIVIKNEVVSAHTGWITVLPETPEEIVMQSISVTTLPTKTNYFAGQTLDLTGMVVTGKMNNLQTIEVKDYTTDPSTSTQLTTDITKVTVKSNGLSCTFDITVSQVELTGIKVTTPPTKQTYNAGDKLNLDGLVVTGTYNDGTSKDVTSECTFSPSTTEELKETDKEVTVTCGKFTDKFNITVNPVTKVEGVKFTASAETTLTWTKGVSTSELQYSLDGGKKWEEVTEGESITFGKDSTQTLQLKGTLVNDASSSKFNMIQISATTATVVLSGSLMDLLLDKSGNPSTTLPDYAFYKLFYNSTGLKSIDETNGKLLPADTLSQNCYNQMFYCCGSLVNAPTLDSTKLADYCYYEMFLECFSLIEAPKLPATTLCKECYNAMFEACISLITAPELKATKLEDGCYNGMFAACFSLKIVESEPQSGGTIFTCPDTTGLDKPVEAMFSETKGCARGQEYTPVKGITYYYDLSATKAEFVAKADEWVTGTNGFTNSTTQYTQDQVSLTNSGSPVTFSDFKYEGTGENRALKAKSSQEIMPGFTEMNFASANYSGSTLSDGFQEETVAGVSYVITPEYISYKYTNAATNEIKEFSLNKYGYLLTYNIVDILDIVITYDGEPTEPK